jgi:hypothetical protein
VEPLWDCIGFVESVGDFFSGTWYYMLVVLSLYWVQILCALLML